jgi:hypothetical protein
MKLHKNQVFWLKRHKPAQKTKSGARNTIEKYKQELTVSAFLRIQLRDILFPQSTPECRSKKSLKLEPQLQPRPKLTIISNDMENGKFLPRKTKKLKSVQKIILPRLKPEDFNSSISSFDYLSPIMKQYSFVN